MDSVRPVLYTIVVHMRIRNMCKVQRSGSWENRDNADEIERKRLVKKQVFKMIFPREVIFPLQIAENMHLAAEKSCATRSFFALKNN